MTLWICIPVHNRIAYTKRCLKALLIQSYSNFRIVVCDDGSTDGTAEYVRKNFGEVVLLEGDGTLWWTGGINRCVEYALSAGDTKKDAVVTLNNDLEVDIDYLSSLVGVANSHPNAIITSAGYDIHTRKLMDPGLRQSWVTSRVRILDRECDSLKDDKGVAEVTHAPGRGTLIPFQVFKKIGLYDQERLPHYGADYDFTHRARRFGYRILISYRSRVFSYIEETGLTTVRRSFGWSDFLRYLTDMKSPANLSTRWWLAVNNCPRLLLPSFLLFDFMLVVASYFKFHIQNAISRKENVQG